MIEKLFKIARTAATVAVLVAVQPAVAATPASAAIPYNFGYVSMGEGALRPMQAFDDGIETFLQVRSDITPAVFVVQSGESRLVATERRGPYLVVPVVADEVILRFGSLEARLVNKSPRRVPSGQGDASVGLAGTTVEPTPGALTQPVSAPATVYGATAPLLGDSNKPTFERQETLLQFDAGKAVLTRNSVAGAQRYFGDKSGVSKVNVILSYGEDISQPLIAQREQALLQFFVTQGVREQDIVIRSVAQSGAGAGLGLAKVVLYKQRASETSQVAKAQMAVERVWRMSKTDGTVSRLLTRWAESAGWSVVWLNAEDVAVVSDAALEAASFDEAAQVVLKQAKTMGYPLNVRVVGRALVVQ